MTRKDTNKHNQFLHNRLDAARERIKDGSYARTRSHDSLTERRVGRAVARAAAAVAVVGGLGYGSGKVADVVTAGSGPSESDRQTEISRNAGAENQQANLRTDLELGRIQPEILSKADNALVESVLETPVERQTLQMGAVYLAPGTEVMNSRGETVFSVEAGSELKVDAGMLTVDDNLVFTMSDPQKPNEPVQLLQAEFDLTNTDGVGNARYESYAIPNGLPGSIANHTQGETPNSHVSFLFHNYDGFVRRIEGKGPDQVVANAEFL